MVIAGDPTAHDVAHARPQAVVEEDRGESFRDRLRIACIDHDAARAGNRIIRKAFDDFPAGSHIGRHRGQPAGCGFEQRDGLRFADARQRQDVSPRQIFGDVGNAREELQAIPEL
jgi:hypothetical protein